MSQQLIPKVSIILPVYNGAKYIRQSIDSCLAQTFDDFELIIVDDCSTDETPDIIQSYQDSRIKCIRNQTNQRLPKSLNIGFARAQGEYLTWTSDDNFYKPEAIERMVEILDKKQCEFVYADIFALHDDRKEAAQYERLKGPKTLHKNNCVRACFLYTRHVMDTIGEYDPEMELIEDYDYWVRISKRFDMHHIEEALYYYRYHDDQLYTARNHEIKIIEILFKVKYDLMEQDSINWLMRNYIIRKSKGILPIKILMSKLYFKPQIQRLFKKYKAGELNFNETKTAILNLTKNVNWQRSKKHFVFLRKLPPPERGEWGGLECLMLDWLKRIDYQSCRVTVAVTKGWKEEFQLKMKGLPLDIVEFPFYMNAKPFLRFKNMFGFLKGLKADRAIFFQAWLWEFRISDVLAGFLATKNNAFMHENLGPPQPPAKTSKKHFGFIPGLAIWWIIPWLMTNLRAYICRNIIVVSHEIKDMLISLWGYPADKVAVRYHGVNIDEYCPSQQKRIEIRKMLNIPLNEIVFVMAVRLTKQKRVDRMIEAFGKLCRDHSEVTLLIAGDGPLEDKLKALAEKKNCADKIIFLGHVNNVADYLKASDISVLSSDNEGFGIALVEALAAGLICISTPTPGPNEIIQNGVNGYLVEKSVDGVFDGLNKVLNLSEEKRKALSRNACKYAGSHFEINKNISEVFKTLRLAYLGTAGRVTV